MSRVFGFLVLFSQCQVISGGLIRSPLGVQRVNVAGSQETSFTLRPRLPFDPVNQTIVALPLMGLYEVGIGLAWLAGRSRRKSAETAVEPIADSD